MTAALVESRRNTPPDRWTVAMLLLFGLHLVMLEWIAYGNSPVRDEVGHLPAGIYHWQFGRFHAYRVNPPLVKLIAALPAVLGHPKLDWSSMSDGPNSRPELSVGRDFIRANGLEAFGYFTAGRMLVVVLTVVGGYFCYRWARQMYGPRAGLVAATLWCFSPTVLGWGSTFTPDAACAGLGLMASYLFWRWLKQPSWRGAFLAGLGLGIAELSKMTWVVLFALWPVIWLVWRQGSSGAMGRAVPPQTTPRPPARQLVLVMLLGLYVLNAGYGFEGTGRRLGEITFVSRPLAGDKAAADGGAGGNRFAGTWLGRLPLPVPINYLRGIDLQKYGFEQGNRFYLFGEWKHGGWWYYYLVAAALKVPLGTWCLGVLALVAQRKLGPRLRDRQVTFRDEFVLLAPAVVVFILVSSQTGVNRHFRYALPCLPPVFVFVSRLFVDGGPRWLARIGGAALAWVVISSSWIYPHSLSYFNELAGGPMGGPRYLIDSNIDWGQDLFRLKDWIERHPEARPIRVIGTGCVRPSDVGIDESWRPHVPDQEDAAAGNSRPQKGLFLPPPAWYAISVHEIYESRGWYRHFLDYQPVATVGYSMYIYDFTRSRPGDATMPAR